jgi:glycosyltransferase involved in cell wall biosynthesis
MHKISIIIPNYNKAGFLKETLDSVLHSTYKNWEVCLVDDGSTDNSWEIIESYCHQDPRIRAIRQSNLGGGAARNKGIEMALGTYLIFLDSDDLLDKKCLSQRIAAAEKDSDGDGWVFPLLPFEGVFSDQQWKDAWIPPKENFLERLVQHEITWTSMSPMWRTSFLQENVRWNSNYPRLQDIEFHTHILLKGAKIYTYPNANPDCYYRLDENKLVLGSRFNYLKKWVDACDLYASEFAVLLPAPLNRKIFKTSIACLEVAGHYYRSKKITRGEFKTLFEGILRPVHGKWLRLVFCAYFFILQLFPIHIPGTARFFKNCIR